MAIVQDEDTKNNRQTNIGGIMNDHRHEINPKPYWLIVVGLFVIQQQLLSFSFVNAYSSGAPNNRKVCTSLIPGHGSKQNTPSPYKLTLSSNGGEEINRQQQQQVVVGLDLVATLPVTFAGFIVQARNLNDYNQIIDGYFTETSNNTHIKNCLSSIHNTWTHDNGEPKTKVSTKWTPLANFNGSVIFVATVVQVKHAYWDQIKSDPVYFINGKTTDVITYSRLINDMANVAENYQKPFELNYDDCQTKLCIGLGEQNDCFAKRTCNALLSVSKNDLDENEFNIHAKPSENAMNSIYYSMAFSDDDKMGDDFVVDCLIDSNGNVRVGLSHNNGKQNDPLTGIDRSIIKQSSGQYIDGIVQCKWKLKPRFQIKNKEYDLQEQSYHIFLAHGILENDRGFKEYHDLKVRTPTPVNLSSASGNLQLTDLDLFIRIHGSLMLIVWFGTVPTAIILARYFKNSWPGRLICGVQVWFAFHRSLMVISLCLMIIAQICIFYYIGEYRVGIHQILGSIAFGLALLQPLGALFRPHPGTSKRWIFNWFHWLGGNSAHILATAAILLASKLKLANLPDSFLYVAIVWVLCHVIMHLLFQFYSFCTSPETKSSDIAMHEMHQRQMYGQQNKSSSKSGFHYFLLTFYVILIIFLVSILVTFVTVPGIVKDFL